MRGEILRILEKKTLNAYVSETSRPVVPEGEGYPITPPDFGRSIKVEIV